MNKITTYILSVIIGCCAAYSKDYDKIPLKEISVPVNAVKNIGGFIGERLRLNREGYIKHFPIEEYVAFIEERNHTSWDWTRAEQHGKWIESAYLSGIQSDDRELIAKAREMLDRIIASQEPEGYLGATAKSYRSPERPIRGMDPYELYFVFHALISVYEQTGYQSAMESAERLADYFLKYFGPGKHEFWPSYLRYPENIRKVQLKGSQFAGHSGHYSWEGTLLADPVARIYEKTGKKKYLDWSKWVVANIDKWSGWDSYSRLDSVADGTLTVDKLQPYVHSHTFHMNFMGFLRLYRITGDESYLRKVTGAWNDIVSRQMYITGGVSVAEHYERDYIKPLSGCVVETCATMSWMQLTQSLLELTGDTKYAEAIEKIMLNHVFAGQDALSGYCRYHTAPNGTKPGGYFHGPDCCSASGHRVISLISTFIYSTTPEGGVVVNQYLPSEYADNGFAFIIEGEYPDTDCINLTVTESRKSPAVLRLRIPSWCVNPKATINGKSLVGVTPGQYLTIRQRLNAGDRIEICFPKKFEWVKLQHHSTTIPYTRHDSAKVFYGEEPGKKAPYALTYGPLVYSLDMVWNPQVCNDDADFDKDIRIDIKTPPAKFENTGCSKMIANPVKVKALYKNRPMELTMVPFTSTGIWFRDKDSLPDKDSETFSYGIWLTADPKSEEI